MPRLLTFFLLMITSFCSCTISGQIKKEAAKFLSDSLFIAPHVGMSVYEPATGKYWYNHNAEKYFLPASTTKLFTLYAGLKYLGDSLPSARYHISSNRVYIYPTGDPSFLHADFKFQPLFNFLKEHPNFSIVKNNWQSKAWGYGWSWDDYNDDYMAERSILPIYGNIINIAWKNDDLVFSPYPDFSLLPAGEMILNEAAKFNDRNKKLLPANFAIKRKLTENVFEFTTSSEKFSASDIPLRTDKNTVSLLLRDTLHNFLPAAAGWINDSIIVNPVQHLALIRSQPSDSLFRIMMHRSDNFFAEQTLLMASNEKLHLFNETKLIDTLLKSELHDIPQKPQWVDGSGLSRYNLFTPQSFIYLLNKMQLEFGMERLKHILATGGEGTLKNYYRKDSGFIFAKTGTISNNLAFCGFIITNQKKFLIFSLMVNAYTGGATPIRKRIEAFLSTLRANH